MPSNIVPVSPDLGFIPRKEFIRDQRTTSNTFSLLAISGSNAIRLYSFPMSVISALRNLFDQRINVTAFREDATHNLCEFSLDGKPWTSPKSVSTEKLLVDVLAVIFMHGHAFLSSIDYGREPDDRLVMAFSKISALPEPPRSGSPFHSSSNADVSGSCFSQSKGKRVPFALSFPSGTMLRVIEPPLHSTPAILAAVRGAWPRGVVSEKKVGDASFEFKLKGYKWFQEDTFATDSLRHILSLLSCLDMHSFSLLTSLSLSNRSRVKDLWIFTGPASSSSDQDILVPESPAPSLVNFSNVDHRAGQSPSPEPTGHRRVATAPGSSSLPQPNSHLQGAQHHMRAATDNNALHVSTKPSTAHTNPNYANLVTPPSPLGAASNNRGLLRKPAPRAQVPVSVIHDNDDRDQRREEPAIRAILPSTVSSDVDNMTGVGVPGGALRRDPGVNDVLYESPLGDASPSPTIALAPPIDGGIRPRSTSPPARQYTHPVSSPPSKTPLSHGSHSHSPPSSFGHVSPNTLPTLAAPRPQPAHSSGAVPLLSPGVFRDSAFSSSTEASVEVPIKWTGGRRTEADEHQERRPKKSFEEKSSGTGHMLPGGWTSTPVKEEPEDTALAQNRESELRPVREVASRVDSPELTGPDERPRKSEAGMVGMIAAPSPPSPRLMPSQKGGGKEGQSEGQGWVLVNVEGKRSPEMQYERPTARSPEPLAPVSTRENGHARSPEKKGVSEQASMSPTAKAIVMVDAIDAKSKSKSKTNKDDSGTGVAAEKGANVKRVLSMNRKTPGVESSSGNSKDAVPETKPRGGLREKLRRLGMTEASRTADGKRRSIN